MTLVLFTLNLNAQGGCNANVGLPDQIVCSGSNVILTAINVQGVGQNPDFVWIGPNGDTLSTSGPVLNLGPATANMAGTYEVFVFSGSDPDCFDSNDMDLIVTNGFSINAGPDMVICPGSPINFNSTIIGNPSGTVDYDWDGPNNYNSSQADPTINNAQPNNSGNYIVSASAGACEASDTVNISVGSVSISSGFFNAQNQLSYCLQDGELTGLIAFNINLPSNQSTVQSVTVNWGDGTSVSLNSSNWSALQSYAYSPGGYSLIINVTLTSGCVLTKTYPVFVGSSPSPASLALFINQANGCVPHATEYNFYVPSTNVNGTTYTVNWGDGSPSEVYTHPNFPATLQHTFTTTSCGSNVNISGVTYYNVFQPSVITQNPCSVQPQPSAAGLISVGQGPAASFTNSSSYICVGSSVNFTNTSFFGWTLPTANGASCVSTSPFYWTITPNTPATLWTLTSGSLGANPLNSNSQATWTVGSNALSVLFNTPGEYTVTLRVKNPCGNSVFTKTICVYAPVACGFTTSPTSGCSPLTVATTNTTVVPTCQGTPIPMSYVWTVTNPTGGTSTITSTTAVNPNITFTNTSNIPKTFIVSLTATPLNSATLLPLTTCASTCTQTVIVNPLPVMLPVGVTSCSSLPLAVALTSNMSATYSWSATSNTNVSGESTTPQSTNTITDILTNLTTVPQVVTYNVTPTSLLGCVGPTQTVTATLNVVSPGTISSDQLICPGGNPAILTGTAPVGAGIVSYQWQSSTNNVTWVDIAGATLATYDPPVTSTVIYYRRIVIYTSNNVACNAISNVVTITINAISSGTIAASQTICPGEDPIILSTVTPAAGSGSISYQWQTSTTSSTTGYADITGQTGTSYDPPATSVTTYYQLIATSTLNGLSCPLATAPITISVISINPGVIAASQTICTGGDPAAFTVTTAASGPGVLTYQWQSSTDNITWTNISNANAATYDPPVATATIYYRRIVISTLNNISCQLISNVLTITVLPDPTITVQPTAAQTICVGGTISSPLSISYTGSVGTASYQWYSVSGATNTLIPSATASTYSPPSYAAAGTFNYFVTVSSTGNGCNAISSANAQVVVIADPTLTGLVNASYCQNSSTVVPLSITVNGGTGTPTYQWYSNAANNNTTGTLIAGATSSTFTPPVSALGTIYYYCIVNQGSNCNATSAVASVLVTSQPTITAQPLATQTLCVGGVPTNLSVTLAGGTGTPSYQWYSNTVNSTVGGTLITGATAATFTPPVATAGTTYYYCVITYPLSGCSVFTSAIGTVILNADPVISTQPLASQTICVGGTIAPAFTVSATGGLGTFSYQWLLNGASISGATLATYTPPTFNTAGTFNYTVNVAQTGNGCSTATSQQAQVVVVADPILTAPIAASYCQNSSTVVPLSVTATGGIPSAYSYQWYSNAANNNTTGTLIAGATSSTYTPSVATIGTFYYYCIVSQGSNCSTSSSTASIIVTGQPTVSVQPLTTQTVCVGGVPTTITMTLAGGTGTPSYQWYSNTTNSNTGGTLIAGATSITYVPPTTTAGTFYYYCVVTYPISGCSTITTAVATVNVVGLPVIATQPLASQTICVGGTISPALSVTYTGGTGTATYQWYTVVGATNTPIAGATASTYTPPTFATAGTYTYIVRVTLSGSGCSFVQSQQAQVIVLADPTVTAPVGASYCQNATPVAPLSVTASGGIASAYTYQWYSNAANNNTTGTLIAGATNSTFTPVVATVGTVYYYCIVSQGSNCSVNSATAAIVTTPGPTFTTNPLATQSICLGGTPAPLTVAYTNGTGAPSYQWFSNTVNSTAGATAIVGATSATFTPPGNTLGTLYYFCTITFATGGCSQIASAIATVNVNTVQSISLQPIASQTICVGGSISPALTVNYTDGAGTATYQWYSVVGATNTLIAGATAASYTPPVFATAGTFNYIVRVTLNGNGCGFVQSTNAQIIVVADPTVSAPVAATYCQNATPVTPLSVNPTGGIATAYSYQWYSNAVNNNTTGTLIVGATSNTFTPSVATVGTVYYYCIVSQGSNCSVNSATAAIVTTASPTITTQPLVTQTLCVGGTATALTVVYSGGAGIPSYQWYSNTVNSLVGATAITGANAISYTPPSTVSGTTYYFCTISLVSSGCPLVTSNIATVIINPDPTISIQPLATQTICVGGSISPALTASYSGGAGTPSYQWYSVVGATNTLISGATAATYTPPVFNTAGTFNYIIRVTLSGNGCGNVDSQTAQVVVVSDPTVSAPISASYCQNATPITPLSVSASGGLTSSYSYQWYSNTVNNNTTGTIIAGATNNTYTPPVATIGTVYYYCLVSQGSNCSTASAVATIQVTAGPTITTQPTASQTLCVGGTATALSVIYTNGSGSPAYQWFSNTTNSTVGATAIVGATSATYTPSTLTSGTTYYFCVISFAVSGCSSITSSIATVIINPDPTISVEPIASQTICVGGTIASALTANYIGGAGTPSYQWYSVVGATNTLITGATAVTYTPPVFNTAGTFNYIIRVTLSGNGCGSVDSQTAQIVVVSDPTVSAPVSAAYCQNATPTPLSIVASGGLTTSYSYQWYSNTVNNNTTGSLIAGATNNTYTPPVGTIGTVYYYCLVSQGSNCSTASAVASIQVTAGPTITTQPTASQTLCVGGTATALSVIYTNGTGSPAYQWFSNTANSTVGATAIVGATSATYTPSTLTSGTTYYFCVISFATGGCSSITSSIATVIINPDPTISIQPLATQTICVGGSISPALTASYTGGTGTPSYQWYSVVGATNTLISGATSATYTPPVFNTAGTFNYIIRVTLSGNGCGNVDSQTAQVVVVSDPTVSAPIGGVYCQNASTVTPLSVNVTGGTGTANYQWYSNTTNSNTGGTLISGATLSTYTPPVAVIGTMYYYCVVSQGTNCGSTSLAAAVQVAPLAIISNQPIPSQIICSGGTLTPLAVTSTGNPSSPNYQWYSNSTNSTTGGTLIVGATSNTYTPSNALIGTTYYYCEIYFSSGCVSLISQISEVIVNDDPTITSQPLISQTVCSGNTIAVPLTASYSGGLGTASYQWFTSTGGVVSPIPGATSSSYTPPAISIPGTFNFLIGISLNGNGCDVATSDLAELIVTSGPSVSPINSLSLCNTYTTSEVIFSGTIPGTTFDWTNNNPSIGLSATGNGNILPFTATNNGTIPISSTVTVIPTVTISGASCQGLPQTFTITVNPFQNVNDPSDIVACNGATVPTIGFTGSGSIYNWTNNTPSIGVGASGSNSISSFTAINAGNVPIVSTFTVTPGFNGSSTCPGDVETFTITVLPTPIVNDIPDQTVCDGNMVSALNFSGLATSYNWTNNVPSIGISANGSGAINNFSAVNASNSAILATINVVPAYSSGNTTCLGNSESIGITVLPTPALAQPQNIVVCNGSPTGNIVFSGNTGSFAWTNNDPSIGIGSSGTGSIPSFAATNPSSVPIVATITVVPSNSLNGTNCAGQSKTFTITINPTPSVSDPTDQVVCHQTATLPITFSGNATSYAWNNSLPSIGLAGTGIGSIASFNGNNLLSNPVTAALTVTPQYLNAGLTCYGTPQNFTITVDPIPTVQYSIPSQIICSDESTLPVTISSATAGAIISWDVVTIPAFISGVPNTSGGSVIQSMTLNNSSVNAEIVQFQGTAITSSQAACVGTGSIYSITVNPLPNIPPISDFTLCNNGSVNVSLTADINSTFSWLATNNANVNGETLIPFNSPTVSNTLQNNGTVIEYVTYTVTPTSSPQGCQGSPVDFMVEVIPDVNLISPITYEICSDEYTNIALQANVTSTFTWVAQDNPNISGESLILQNGNFINDQLINTTTLDQFVTYLVTPTSSPLACPGITKAINVLVHPSVRLSNLDSLTICSEGNVSLNLQGTENAVFSWYATNNGIVQGETTVSQSSDLINDLLINNSTTQQEVVYNIEATSILTGCTSSNIPVWVFVNPLPILQHSDVTICSGQIVNYNLISNIPSTYTWSAAQNSSVVGESISTQTSSVIDDELVNLSNVTQTVVYTVTPSAAGCVGPSNNINVQVTQAPNIGFTVANSPLCVQSLLDITNTSSPTLDFVWTFGDGGTSTDPTPLYSYNAPGTYTITLNAVDLQSNCSGVATETVTILGSPTVDFDVSDTAGCVSMYVTFTDLVNAPNTSVLWDFGDGQISNQVGAIDHQYLQAGCYDVTLTITNTAGCAVSVTQSEMVCAYDNPNAMFYVNNDTVFTTATEVLFTNQSTNAYSYLWDFSDGTTSLAIDPAHTFPEVPLDYVVTLYAYNEAGCYDTMMLTVTVFEELIYYVPNSFTPNNDGTNDIFLPTMTSGFDRDSYELIIFNRWGEQVFSTKDPDTGWDGSLYNAGLSSASDAVQDGVYTWKIRCTGLQNELANEYVGHVVLLK